MTASHFGWTEDDYRRAHAAMPKVLELAKRFHAAGVRLSIGTDGTGGGPSFVRELELHVQAGIPAWEVLRLATSGAAERLGMAERRGTLAPGSKPTSCFSTAIRCRTSRTSATSTPSCRTAAPIEPPSSSK